MAGQRALITGASSGIGQAIACTLVNAGAAVIITICPMIRRLGRRSRISAVTGPR
ncbi:MAG: SDR family NAD(P)-dependent oxidoreductase [Pseudomonas sp.]|nr:SDR family NAD(P)-dependent oxidoreductase [Pseudomonas sp.]